MEQVEAIRRNPGKTWGERIHGYLRGLPLEGLTSMDTWPPDATQDGIASALCMSRAHACLDLKRLAAKGLVECLSVHVKGARSRRKVYRAFPAGERLVYEENGVPIPLVTADVHNLRVVVLRCPNCGGRSRVALKE